MAIRWIDGPDAGTVEFEGMVLSCDHPEPLNRFSYHRYATVWTGERIDRIALDRRAPDDPDDPNHPFPRDRWYRAVAEVDAGPEVREAADRYEAIERLVVTTEGRLRRHGEIRSGATVVVFKGRKIPPGNGLWRVLRTVPGGAWRGPGATDLENLETGEYAFRISTENLRLHEPEKAVEGEVACGICRRTFPSAFEAGMLCGPRPEAWCRDCRREKILDGEAEIPLPLWASSSDGLGGHKRFRRTKGFRIVEGFPAMRGDPWGEALLSEVFDKPDDRLAWSAWCDLLEEKGDPRAESLREALFGRKTRSDPIRLKNLKVGPWKMLEKSESREVFECEITGFPPREGCDTVAVRVSFGKWWDRYLRVYRRTSGDPWFSLRKKGTDDFGGWSRRVIGPLLKACRKVVRLPDPENRAEAKEEA